MLEGPIKKAKEGKGGITFVVSGKHSYLEQSSEMYKPYFQGLSSENARGVDTLGLPYGFTDLYGKISFNGDNGNKFSVFGFNFRDAVNYSDVSKLNWKSGGGGVNFILIPSTSKTLIDMGGWLGITPLYASFKFRDVIAFECDEEALKRFKMNYKWSNK